MDTNTSTFSEYCELFRDVFRNHPFFLDSHHNPVGIIPQSTVTLGPPQEFNWKTNEAKRYVVIRFVDRKQEGLVEIEIISPLLNGGRKNNVLTDTLICMVNQCLDDLPKKCNPQREKKHAPATPQATMKWTPPDRTSFYEALCEIKELAEEILQLMLQSEERLDDINRTIREHDEMLSMWIKVQLLQQPQSY